MSSTPYLKTHSQAQSDLRDWDVPDSDNRNVVTDFAVDSSHTESNSVQIVLRPNRTTTRDPIPFGRRCCMDDDHRCELRNLPDDIKRLMPSGRLRLRLDAIGSTDPFDALPKGPHDQPQIVCYYNSHFIQTFSNPGLRKQYFPMAMNDLAFYNSIMMVAAADMALAHGKPLSTSFWYYRGQAIKEVNSRVGNLELAKSNGTIGAIAVLCLADCVVEQKIGVRAHSDALQRLISARGGLDNIDATVQKLIGWIDLQISIVLCKPPQLNPTRFLVTNRDMYYGAPSSSTIAYASAIRTRLSNFTGQQELSQSVAEIYWGLRNLSVLKGLADRTDSTEANGIQYSDRCELLEREVQKLLVTVENNNTTEFRSNGIFKMIARTSLIYIYSAFRDCTMNMPMYEGIARRLEMDMDIDDSAINILLGTFPDLMLWVLFIGGGVASTPRKVWFAKMATRILRIKKVEDDEVAKTSSYFLWPEGYQNYDDTMA